MKIKPITLAKANEFINANHRHSKRVRGWKYGVSLVSSEGDIIGVAISGRPNSRHLDSGSNEDIIEVSRLCVLEGAPKNACSMLYGASIRIAKAMGYSRVITYTLASESGSSLKAVGFKVEAQTRAAHWSCPSRPREQTRPAVARVRWGKRL